MWLILLVLAVACFVIGMWWANGRRRSHIVRQLRAAFGDDTLESAVFLKMLFAMQNTIGGSCSQSQYDVLALSVWGMPAEWRAGVASGRIDLKRAFNDLIDFQSRIQDPNDPLMVDLENLGVIPPLNSRI